jgi:hypothetical protein
MNEAHWIPGIPTSPGWYMVKGPDRKPTVIEVTRYQHDKCPYYYSMGYAGRIPFESTMPHQMKFSEVFTHYCPIFFPAA